MFAARDQENLAFNHPNNAAHKQQQGQVNRHMQPKTPGARYPNTPMKVPLNDENGAHVVGGAKSILGGRPRGNENALTSKGLKDADKSTFATPMQPRSRAVLGDKTTNAKARGQQPVIVKSAIRELEKSQAKIPNTVKSKQRQPQVESQKLQVHAETDPLSDEEVEYCPPRPKDLPYESDVFPDGILKFDALKPENLMKGYYQYYFNPVDEHGVPLADRRLEENTRKALEEGERRILEEFETLEWSIEDELGPAAKKGVKAAVPAKGPFKAASTKQPAARKPLSTLRAKNAAEALSMDDKTRSLQRKTAKALEPVKPLKKKTTSFAIPASRNTRQPTAIPRKTSLEIQGIQANSRTTIGYNKGRSTASMLTKGTKNDRKAPKLPLPTSGTTTSNESVKTVTPARSAQKQTLSTSENEPWKERVPFLSIFKTDDDDDDDFELVPGGMPPPLDDEEEVELKILG